MKLKDFLIGYHISYLPTKRHRNAKVWFRSALVDVEITEVKIEEFPVAFIVHDYHTVYEGAKKHDFKGNGEFKILSDEIRMHEGKLYKALRFSHGTAVSTLFESPDCIKNHFYCYPRDDEQPKDFSEASIIKRNTKDEMIADLERRVNECYIVCDGKVWERCEEPYYTYNTFGLGNNHGGTGFFIQYGSSDFVNSTTFNALDRDKTIEHTVFVALNRGDTNDVNRIKNTDMNIEVLIPEAVKIRSREEYDAEVAKKQAFNKKKVIVEFSIEELRQIVEGLREDCSFDLAAKVESIIFDQERENA